MKKILVATGGTGGHIYPALVTAAELQRRGCEVVFAGTLGAAESRVRDAGFVCIPVTAKGFVAKGLFQKFQAVWVMALAVGQCVGVIRRLRPDAVLGFGGYSSFPGVAAGCLCGVPTLLHEQNAMPGQANRLLGKFVRRVAVGFKDAAVFFPQKKTVWTGNPARPLNGGMPREEAHRAFGLDPLRSTVLVFGGSQGSRVLNTHVVQALAGASRPQMLQVIHITGCGGLADVRARYAEAGMRALVVEYMEDMARAYAAADLVIGRAGAGTVSEIGLLGVPALFIPYPGAGDHQKYNARVLERLGTGSIIEEKCLRQDTLRDKIFSQLRRDPDGTIRAANRERSKADFVCDGAERLSDEVLRLIP